LWGEKGFGTFFDLFLLFQQRNTELTFAAMGLWGEGLSRSGGFRLGSLSYAATGSPPAVVLMARRA